MKTSSSAVARGGYGAVLLLCPSAVSRVLGAQAGSGHPVLRILGVRQLVEAAAVTVRPTQAVVDASVAVDALHIASCLALAAFSRQHRRPAIRDAAVGSALLAGSWFFQTPGEARRDPA